MRLFGEPLEYVEEPVELLDLFPTLVDLAGLDPVEKCTNPLLEVQCTQGHSRSSKMTNERSSNNVAISQYPRPSLHPTLHSDMPPNGRTNYMGYTIRTTTHRYTEWVGYNISDYRPDRSRLVAQELYDHREDGEEHFNIVNELSAKSWLEYFVNDFIVRLVDIEASSLRAKWSWRS